MSGDEIEIHRADEWSGLYLNGELQTYGDHHHAEEWLYERFGVKVVDNPSWLVNDKPYATLGEMREAQEKERLARIEAAELREQAEALIQRANRLDPRTVSK